MDAWLDGGGCMNGCMVEWWWLHEWMHGWMVVVA